MALPGKFDVSGQGSASYTIPISVVPGTAGLQPKLDLVYDSRGGNGLLGVGWSLAGLPAITRCGRTIAQDGVTGGVAFDANDRFCLDGQRLVAISGTYGSDGTEYRTELESFSKIVGYGSAGSGPAWFKAWTKAGLVLEFGNSADSRIEAQGKSSARVWALNKTSDTAGNYFTASYTEDGTNGEYRPDRIDYTGNAAAGLSPYASVRFVYEDRTDVELAYLAGSQIKQTKRLAKVQTWRGNDQVAEYRLSYDAAPSTRRSRLTQVKLCNNAGACLPETNFGWSAGSGTTLSTVDNLNGANGTLSGYVANLADFNGDGKTDIFWMTTDQYGRSSGLRVIWLSNGNGSFQTISNVAGLDGSFTPYVPYFGDYNGDGKADILWDQQDAYGASWDYGSPQGLRALWLSNGDGTFTIKNNINAGASPGNSFHPIPMNVTGDGRTDIMWVARDIHGRTTGPRVLWVYNGSDANNPFDVILNVAGQDGLLVPYVAYPGDYNGDGLTDILWDQQSASGATWDYGSPQGLRVLWLSKGDGTYTVMQDINSGSVPGNNLHPIPVDLNDDGITDVLWVARDMHGRTTGQRILWLSRGDGTFEVSTNVAGQDGSVVPYVPYFGDFNGDGKADILWDQQDAYGATWDYGSPLGLRVLWQTNSGNAIEVINNFNNSGGAFISHHPSVADFDGDGYSDVMWDARNIYYQSNGVRALWMRSSAAPPPDLLTQITSGSGSQTALSYDRLNTATTGFYTKDTGASACLYPCVDVSGPMYTVSEVRASNGIGGEYRSTYRYAGAKAHAHGRGFLGFRETVVRDEQTGIEQISTYLQDYPYIGMLSRREKKLAATAGAVGPQLNLTENSYGAETLAVANGGGLRRFVKLTQSVERSWELPASGTGTGNGTALPVVTTSYQYDAYGNATEVGVSTGDGYSKVTSNTYSNDVTNWFLGRLTRAVVTSTTPGGITGNWSYQGNPSARIYYAFTFINEYGASAQGYMRAPRELVVSDWGNLVGTITADGKTIIWSNGSQWTRSTTGTMNGAAQSITGAWSYGSLATSIQVSGYPLRIVNESGGVSRGSISGPNTIIAVDWGNLVGAISSSGTQINWANGSSWAITSAWAE